MWFMGDAIEFHRLSNGDYKTPWYSSNWAEAPYINLQLSLRQAREYRTSNAIRTESWLIREVPVGDVTFWTTVQRTPF